MDTTLRVGLNRLGRIMDAVATLELRDIPQR